MATAPMLNGMSHFAPKAKSVIWLLMRGGVSHMESFDPKPLLNKYAGKTIGETPFADVQDPERLKKTRVVVVNDANGQQRNKIYPLQVGFKKYGKSGIEVSDWSSTTLPMCGNHPYGFSVWMAGGGLKGGIVHGATDEIGFHAAEQPHYVTDVHATLLHQLGLHSHHMHVPEHKRLEQDYGSVIEEIIA